MRGFFSINLDAYRDALDRIDVPVPEGMQRARKYHITLMFYPDVSETAVRSLKDLPATPFRLKADRIMAYPNTREPDLHALCFEDERELRRIREHIASKVPSTARDVFHPHITLAGNPRLGSDFQEGRELVRKVAPVFVNVESVHFVRSIPRDGMRVYENLFEIPLGV